MSHSFLSHFIPNPERLVRPLIYLCLGFSLGAANLHAKSIAGETVACSEQRIEHIADIPLTGEIAAAADISGITIAGDYLLIGGDEGAALQVMEKGNGPDVWRVKYSKILSSGHTELDLEAISYADGYVYAVGSHAKRRKRVKRQYSREKNARRFLQVEMEDTRNSLFRIPFNKYSGELGEAKRLDLSKRLRKDDLLGPFTAIPSKENGVDIEGLGIRGNKLYLGFRGPVFRHNLVPVWVLDFDRPKRYETVLVKLMGQGIRDMVALDQGFLLLTGAVNDAPMPFRLWWWDGEDQLPGEDVEILPSICLGEITAPQGAKAEGITVLSQTEESVDLLVVYDGVVQGGCVHLRVDMQDVIPH